MACSCIRSWVAWLPPTMWKLSPLVIRVCPSCPSNPNPIISLCLLMLASHIDSNICLCFVKRPDSFPTFGVYPCTRLALDP
jgi:hypothetical protein